VLSDDRQIEEYDKVGNDHNAWASSADGLLAASRLLRKLRTTFDLESVAVGVAIPDEGRIHPADLMLRGFAVECLLKALWVKQGGTYVSMANTLELRGQAITISVNYGTPISYLSPKISMMCLIDYLYS
jgi:hypothetical protein